MSTMFFQSKAVNTHWDTWLYFYEGQYFLYYLSEIDGRWGGFGAAVSQDGVVWKDQGLVLTASDKMVNYLGTGSVWKSPNFNLDKKFIVNYSEWQCINHGQKQQRIFFAQSKDLIHWEKIDEAFDIEQKYYRIDGRWDCIYPIERAEGGYYGTWTATPNDRKDRNGGIGFGFTKDGIHWTALESKGVFPDADESGAIIKHGGKYYAMFGCYGVGMVGYYADHITGPYQRCKENASLLPPDKTYFSRFLKTDQELLVNHHAITKFKSESGFSHCYMAPLKKAEIVHDSIHLKYWHGNDKLKQLGEIKEHNFGPKSCFLIEGTICDGDTLCIGREKKTYIVYEKGQINIYDYPGYMDKCTADIKEKGYCCGEENIIRILLKHSVFEVYINDIYMTSYSMAYEFEGTLRLTGQTVWEIPDIM